MGIKLNFIKNIGPGALVTAAFIGPGTVTVCTLAGVQFGYALLWALLLSVIATVVLQEMAARLGILTGKSLSQAILGELKNKTVRSIILVLILVAILIGNSAYEAGNISGGALGLDAIIPNTSITLGTYTFSSINLVIGLVAFVLLYLGSYKVLEKALITLVIVMSLSFVVTAILTKPDLAALFKGLLVPSQPSESIFTIIALIGTTVVPYNLFLHASVVREKWHSPDDLPKVRKDTLVSIGLGGIVSMAIVISAAAIQGTQVVGATDLAKGLAPLYGTWAKYFIGIALFAAGITSAITAPMAAAYVAKGCFNWDANLKSAKFRAVWIIVLLLGVIFSVFGGSPIEIIKVAQIANGLLLPIIAILLIWVVNRKQLLAKYVNNRVQNILGIVIVVITLLISYRTLSKVIASWLA
ncbi:MAG: Nramp family divalent metal transporter [Gilvibacter sp.]